MGAPMSDKLSELLVPSLIEQFDNIPAETELHLPITKGELALLLKSQYQLHNGLSALIGCVSMLAFTDDARGKLALAFDTLQSSLHSVSGAADTLIARAVEGHAQ